MGQNKVEKNLLVAAEQSADIDSGVDGTHLAGDRIYHIGHMRQYIEQITLLSVDYLLHLGQLLAAKTFLSESLQEFLACFRKTPDSPQVVFVLEKLRQLAEELQGKARASCYDIWENPRWHSLWG